MISKRPPTPASSEETFPFRVVSRDDTREPPRASSVWRGLVRYEWHAHRRWLLGLMLLWLAMVWLIPWFGNPEWLLACGFIYALLGGPAFGGKDVLEGCEEFAFSLAGTRSEWYWIRLLVGGGILALITGMDVLALGLDLSQSVARWYIDTGLMRPTEVLKPRLLYGLVITLPAAVFGIGFALAANARSRSIVLTSWFWAAVSALAILRLGLWIEVWAWGVWTGYVACPGLMVGGVAVLGWGFLRCRRKEIAAPSRPLLIPAHWWWWSLLLLISLALSILLIRSILTEFHAIGVSPGKWNSAPLPLAPHSPAYFIP
jgi:hypothetical protein